MKYQAYEEYKTADLDWLSQIPSHWEIKRLKYLGDALIGLTYSPDDVVNEGEGVLVLRSSNVQNKQLAFDDNVYVNKKVPSKLITKKGDILLCARNGSRALIGKNAQIDEKATGITFGAFMSIFRSPYNDYLSKVFNSPLFESQSGSFLTATINQLTTRNLNSFEIPLPSEVERKKIANFLDHETAKIDTLIEKQQLLIKLLKEKRQAVISHAVTKGLNPNAPMRDSGVEWLGEVPEHWIIKRLKFVCNLITKKTTTKNKTVIALENIESWTGKYIKTESEYGGEDVEFVSGDILFGKLRPYLAKVYAALEEGVAFGDLLVYRPNENMVSQYCFYQMLSEGFIAAVDSSTYGSKMPRASAGFMCVKRTTKLFVTILKMRVGLS